MLQLLPAIAIAFTITHTTTTTTIATTIAVLVFKHRLWDNVIADTPAARETHIIYNDEISTECTLEWVIYYISIACTHILPKNISSN